MKRILLRIIITSVILAGLCFLGMREKKEKEEQAFHEARITGVAGDWFGWLAQDKPSEALDLCGYPFDANGVEQAANRAELEKILPHYLDTAAGDWPWTRASAYLMEKFQWRPDDPNPREKQTLPRGTRVILVWLEHHDDDVRVYVRPEAEPKIIGFKVEGFEKRPKPAVETPPATE